MSWNRPNTVPSALSPTGAGKKNSIIRGILAGAIVVAAGVAAWFLLAPSEHTDPTKTSKHSSQIKEVAPVATNKPVAVKSEKKKKWPDKPPRGEDMWRHGEGPRSVAVTNGTLVTYPNYPGVTMIIPRPEDRPPFRNICDNEIASILSVRPGQTAIEVPMPHDFDKRFLKALEEPIKITEEDTPEKAELKRQVIEARAILKEAMDRGESPRQILIDERKNMRKLMAIRDNYQAMINEQVRNGASDQELSDTVAAANKLLKSKGVDGKVHLPYRDKIRIDKAKKDGSVKELDEL